MGIMDVLKNMGKDKSEFKRKYKEAEEQLKIENRLTERSKSANERELERYMKENHEAEIKRQLDIIHKKQNKDNWKSNSILKGQTSILKEDKKILSSGSSGMLKKSAFLDNKTRVPITKQQLFFKL